MSRSALGRTLADLLPEALAAAGQGFGVLTVELCRCGLEPADVEGFNGVRMCRTCGQAEDEAIAEARRERLRKSRSRSRP